MALNVRMFRSSKELQEIEHTEFKKQTGSLQSIDAGQLKLSPDVSGGSVESLITTMAGVNSSNEMSSQYSVRGGSFDENSVYINGIEVYRPLLITSGQQEGLSIINPDMVDKIGFSTGGFSAAYGTSARHNLPPTGIVRRLGRPEPDGRKPCIRPIVETILPAPRRQIQAQQFVVKFHGHERGI